MGCFWGLCYFKDFAADKASLEFDSRVLGDCVIYVFQHLLQNLFTRRYPLINVYITMERSTIFMGKSAISMAIFNSYIKQKIPEGILVGGFNPSEKYEFVSWDYGIPNIWKVKLQSCSKPPTRSPSYSHCCWFIRLCTINHD